MTTADDERLATGRLLLGRRLREERIQRDLQLTELAAKAGVSVAFLSDLERGRRLPSLQTLDALARELGTSAAAMLLGVYPWGSDEPPSTPPTAPPDGRAGRRVRARQ
ncbi:hypothetical protein GCM10009623_34330 [Nocardioides aestuarii]|uniref:Helix-turn-helix domain-containing protein n=1 Tax=Nocardioides aestuarii TaxID=252231 RepID=A0ABW4TPS5_9ACTN